jgi:branched-chain amino acid transport system permease protein
VSDAPGASTGGGVTARPGVTEQDIVLTPRPSRRPWLRLGIYLALLVAACFVPAVLTPFWLQAALFALIAGVGALSLNLLMGHAGMISIAPTFFLAAGGYTYVVLAAEPGTSDLGTDLHGLELPPVLAAVIAVAFSGVLGWILSPLAGRLNELYLAVATLGLVFLTLYVLDNAKAFTGGVLGRAVPPFEIFGYTFSSSTSLYFLSLGCLCATWLYVSNLFRMRPGRAVHAMRDNPIAAAAAGVNIGHYRARIFVVSGTLGGLCGVLSGLAFQHLIPDYFSFFLVVNYMAMIVIGGLGSPVGAVAGAVFVTFLPRLFAEYGGWLPFMASETGFQSSGFTAEEMSQILFGVAIALFLLFEPRGIVGISRRVAAWAGAEVATRRSKAAVGTGRANV